MHPFKIAQVNIDLDEIQELDQQKIIEHKLAQAFKHHKGPFIVEDGSLYFDCLNKQLPGPLIRWFNDSISNEGMFTLAKKMGNNNALAQTIIAYAKSPKEIYFFEGNVRGKIVSPRGSGGFGYDNIFMPNGSKKVLAELKEGNVTKYGFRFSSRGLAAKKFKDFLFNDQTAKGKSIKQNSPAN